MIKVCILDRCEICDGEAYIFDYQDVDSNGETYDLYLPSEMCHCSGYRAKWASLQEFAELLNHTFDITQNFDLKVYYISASEWNPINRDLRGFSEAETKAHAY